MILAHVTHIIVSLCFFFQGKVELDEFDVVYVSDSCGCSSSGDASYGTRRDQLDIDACKATSVHVDTSSG